MAPHPTPGAPQQGAGPRGCPAPTAWEGSAPRRAPPPRQVPLPPSSLWPRPLHRPRPLHSPYPIDHTLSSGHAPAQPTPRRDHASPAVHTPQATPLEATPPAQATPRIGHAPSHLREQATPPPVREDTGPSPRSSHAPSQPRPLTWAGPVWAAGHVPRPVAGATTAAVLGGRGVAGAAQCDHAQPARDWAGGGDRPRPPRAVNCGGVGASGGGVRAWGHAPSARHVRVQHPQDPPRKPT